MAQFDVSNRLYVVIWVFVLPIIAFAIIAGFDYWSYVEGDYAREFTVEGTGTAFVVPDNAKVSFGVYSEGDTVDEVTEDGNDRMEAVMAALEELGIEEDNVKTTGYFLDANYEWTEAQGSFQDGFYLDQTIQVSFDDFEVIPDAITAVTAAGADMAGGVQFDVADVEAAKDMAREEAIANAKKKAEVIADESGLKLGNVVNYWEYEDYYYDDYYYGGYAEPAIALEKSLDSSFTLAESEELQLSSPTISPGEQEITLNVSLTYRIK